MDDERSNYYISFDQLSRIIYLVASYFLSRLINENDWVFDDVHKCIYSNLLKKYNFKHAFFLKNSYFFTPQELIKVSSKNYSTYQLTQIHSNKIIICDKSICYPWPKGDGIISLLKEKQSLWIYTADCIPILFADKSTGQVAAIHAGWRGISKRIIENALNEFKKNGSNIKNIIVALGPAISCNKYQVDSSTIKRIGHSIINSNSYEKKNEDEFIIISMINSSIIKKDKTDKNYLLDIRLSALNQLLIAGLNKHQISINKNCTFSEDKLFFSWRRNQKKLFQWSFIESQ